MAIEKTADSTFEKDVGGKGLTLVDFWAVWCHPCKMLEPTMNKLHDEYSERGVRFLKLNVDDNPNTASKYNILSIPSVLFFKDGKVVDRIVGALPKPQFVEKIEQNL